MGIEGAAWTSTGEPPRSRRTTHALVLTEGDRASAALIDSWDRPPAWADVPSTDLQPLVADALMRGVRERLLRAEDDRATWLRRALLDAERSLRALAEPKKVLFAGSGAEAIVATLERGRASVAWAGTVRAYLVKDGRCTLLTTDHTLGNDDPRQPPEMANVVTSTLLATREEGAARVDTIVVDRPGRAALLLTSARLRTVEISEWGREIENAPSAHEAATSIALRAAPQLRGESFGIVVLRWRD